MVRMESIEAIYQAIRVHSFHMHDGLRIRNDRRKLMFQHFIWQEHTLLAWGKEQSIHPSLLVLIQHTQITRQHICWPQGTSHSERKEI